MAHGITDTDSMISTREVPWHKLGTVLEDYPTAQEAKALAHPWEPVSEPVFAEEPSISEDGDLGSSYVEIAGYQAIRRSDNGQTLGILPNTYSPIANQTMYDIAEALEGESKGTVQFETGGSLQGGKRVWLMMKLREPLVIRGDEETATIPYFALQNSHDGSTSFRGQATMTRIVCQNTAQAADIESKMRGTEFRFRHSSKVQDRLDQAHQALAGWRTSIEDYRMFSEQLASEDVTRFQVDAFVRRFFPEPSAAGQPVTDRVLANVDDSRNEWKRVYESETNETIRHTRYGLLQASIEYVQWNRRAHTESTRFRRTVLDDNALVKRASKIAQAV